MMYVCFFVLMKFCITMPHT